MEICGEYIMELLKAFSPILNGEMDWTKFSERKGHFYLIVSLNVANYGTLMTLLYSLQIVRKSSLKQIFFLKKGAKYSISYHMSDWSF